MLWGFGDSFTFGHGCRADGPLLEYYNKYKKEGDKIWLDWLGYWFNEDVKNISECGASNDKIYDFILKNISQIKKDDKVIIGATIWDRKDICYNGEWVSLLSFTERLGRKILLNHPYDLLDEHQKTLMNFQYFFSDINLWEAKWRLRYDFLIKILRDKDCNVQFFQIREEFLQGIERISRVSEFEDPHFSFDGNKEFAKIMHKRLSKTLSTSLI